MAITPPTVTAAIIAAAPDLPGTDFIRLATLLGIAITSWAQIPANVLVQGVTTGAIGAGTVTGKLIVPPQPLPVNGAFAGASLLGLNAQQMARGIGVGVGTAFSSAGQYIGASAGVGAGTDISKITFANPATLTAAIMAAAPGLGFQGQLMAVLAGAVGTGVSSLLLTGTGVGAVAGAGGPSPSGGTSISKVL